MTAAERHSHDLKQLAVRVGGEIRRRRVSLGYTVRGFAAHVGVTPRQVMRYERQQITPDLVTLVRIATALECSTDALLNGETT